MKRILCLAVSLCLFLCAVSCSSAEPSAKGTGIPTSAEDSSVISESSAPSTEESYNLPVKDFDGFELRAYAWNDCRWANTMFDVEESGADVVSDAIYNRNRQLEELYNIKISEVGFKEDGQVVKAVEKDVAAGLNSFELAFVPTVALANLITKGVIHDLSAFPHIDVTKPWWDKGSVDDLSIGGKYYALTGDIHYMSFDATWILTFNKKLLQDYSLESPYELVKNNKWTLDKFAEMLKATSKDLDGNGKYDEKDSYGFATHSATYGGLYIGAGQRFFDKDTEDYPRLIPLNNDMEGVFAKILDIMHTGNRTFDPTGKYADAIVLCDVFVQDRALFMGEVMGALAHELLRSMKSDYGVVPWPKYSEAQEGYYNYVHPAVNMMVVPSSCPDTERLGLLLEAMAYQSYKVVRPAFYDTALRLKSARDETSFEMLNLIYMRRIYEPGMVYQWGNLCADFDKSGVNNKNNLSSLYDQKSSKINEQLEKFIALFKT